MFPESRTGAAIADFLCLSFSIQGRSVASDGLHLLPDLSILNQSHLGVAFQLSPGRDPVNEGVVGIGYQYPPACSQIQFHGIARVDLGDQTRSSPFTRQADISHPAQHKESGCFPVDADRSFQIDMAIKRRELVFYKPDPELSILKREAAVQWAECILLGKSSKKTFDKQLQNVHPIFAH